MRETEVVVVGLGAMGSAALYHLARQGVAPVGIEQFEIGHSLGSSHGHSRAFRTLYQEAVYTRLAEAAIPLWRDLELVSGEKLLNLTGMAIFAGEDNQKLQTRIDLMDEVGSPYDLMTSREVTARFPGLHPPDGSITCFTPRAGFVDAGRCVMAHVSQARQRGATVHDQVEVLDIDLANDRPEVVTTTDRYRCDRLVIAAGPWAARVLQDLDLPLRVTRQQKFYFRPRKPELYVPGRLPVYADYEKEFYGFPFYGPGIKVADDGLGLETTPDDVDRALDKSTQNRLVAWIRAILPDLDPTFVSGSTCMYTLTPDRDFLIGPHPHHPNVTIAAGFSGHGFKFSTLVGKILADLATTGTTEYPIERFGLDRLTENHPPRG